VPVHVADRGVACRDKGCIREAVIVVGEDLVLELSEQSGEE